MLFIVQISVSSPVERRQILKEIKLWINLLHVDLTPSAWHWQLQVLWPGPVLCSGGPGCCLGWADSPWFIFVLHSHLFSPLLLSFQVFLKCSNINLICEDKEEAWTFLWMCEEVGGCCNTSGRVISRALHWEINHLHLLLEFMRFVCSPSASDGNLEIWECSAVGR